MTNLQFGTAIHRALLECATVEEVEEVYRSVFAARAETAVGRAFGVVGIPTRPFPFDAITADGRIIDIKTVRS